MNNESDELDAYVREELPKIIRLVQNSRVRRLDLRSNTGELSIERAGPVAAGAGLVQSPTALAGETAEPIGPHVRTVTAPMVGVYYHAEQPGRAALVQEGSHVERGGLIGVIEALQVLTEVESDATGTVQRVVAGDGEPVEFGQALVEVLVEA